MPDVPTPPGWNGTGRADVLRNDFGRFHKYDEASGETSGYPGADRDDDDSPPNSTHDALDDPRSYRNLSGVDTYQFTED